jgi:MYXO-CTERM domain-containing protein
MHLRGWAIVVSAVLIHQTASAAVLYQPSGTQFPEGQGWLSYFALGTAPTRSADSTKTTFTTGFDTQGGWTNWANPPTGPLNPSFPNLDRTAGFTLNFGVKIVSESHNSTDRAGFSVILLASDHQGIELGFWPTEIWAQSSTFTHAEGTAGTYDTTVARNYALTIQGSTYTLNDGSSNILTGSLRDYSAAMAVPYGLNNYLFIGDNTTSATASTELTGVSIVPEPTALPLLGLGALLLRRRRAVA